MEGGNLVGASHGPDDSVHGAEDVSKVVAMMCAVGEVVEFKNSFLRSWTSLSHTPGAVVGHE